MYLSFLGAAHEVTGSCYLLEACGKKILIDCGMQQGPDQYQRQENELPPVDADFLLLTHAHIDHSGKIPFLVKCGFQGSILCTGATASLCEIMLRDSAHIQEFEAEWRNRKAKRSGQEIFEPLYTTEDAEKSVELFVPYPYNTIIELCEGVRVRFIDAGHLLGSASIEVWVKEGEIEKKLVFSGDIGNLNQPLIKDPEYIAQADYVIMESTYGNREHPEAPNYYEGLAEIIQRTFARGGNVVIPSFAVGRTQELLYFIRDIVEKKMIPGYSSIPVYVDSPLAVEATNIFNRNMIGYFDEEAMELVNQGINPIAFPGLHISVTSDDSKAINFISGSKVIISASGMCEAGRIKHHLKHNLWRPESTVVFVGYQAYGTLGRSILEGAKTVKLFGETIEIRAEIVKLEGVSGHADKSGLLKWLHSFEEKPQNVFVVHGENTSCESFTAHLRGEGYSAVAPLYGSKYDLIANTCMEPGVLPQAPSLKPAVCKTSVAFARLLAAGQRLLEVIRKNEHGANKDLAKFTDQINSLCEKWEK